MEGVIWVIISPFFGDIQSWCKYMVVFEGFSLNISLFGLVSYDDPCSRDISWSVYVSSWTPGVWHCDTLGFYRIEAAHQNLMTQCRFFHMFFSQVEILQKLAVVSLIYIYT